MCVMCFGALHHYGFTHNERKVLISKNYVMLYTPTDYHITKALCVHLTDKLGKSSIE